MLNSLKEYNINEYVKITYSDNADTEYQLQEGMNDVGDGYITFYKYCDVKFWFRRYYDAHIWRVRIPAGETIYESEHKLMAKRIILHDCKKFYEIDDLCQLAVSCYPLFLEYVKTKTPYLCHLAIINRNFEYVRKFVDKYGLVDVKEYEHYPRINFLQSYK